MLNEVRQSTNTQSFNWSLSSSPCSSLGLFCGGAAAFFNTDNKKALKKHQIVKKKAQESFLIF
jgi:DNA polymerase III delta subunit